MVSTTYAWLPSYFNRFYGLAPDQAGLKTGLVVLVGGVGAIVWSVVADRLHPRIRMRPPVRARGRRGADDRLHGAAPSRSLPPGNAQFVLIVAGGLRDGGQHRPDRRRRHRRHPPGSARHRRRRSCRSRRTCSASPAGRCSPACSPTPTACSSRCPWCRSFCLARRRCSSCSRRAPTNTDLQSIAGIEPTTPKRRLACRSPPDVDSESQTHMKITRPARHPRRGQPRKASGNWNPGLGAVRQARSGVDREGDRDGDRAGGRRRARREDDRTDRHRARCLVHAPVRARRAPAHPARAEGRRDEGRNHRRAAARQPAGPAQHVRRRADPARGTRARAAQPKPDLRSNQLDLRRKRP